MFNLITLYLRADGKHCSENHPSPHGNSSDLLPGTRRARIADSSSPLAQSGTSIGSGPPSSVQGTGPHANSNGSGSHSHHHSHNSHTHHHSHRNHHRHSSISNVSTTTTRPINNAPGGSPTNSSSPGLKGARTPTPTLPGRAPPSSEAAVWGSASIDAVLEESDSDISDDGDANWGLVPSAPVTTVPPTSSEPTPTSAASNHNPDASGPQSPATTSRRSLGGSNPPSAGPSPAIKRKELNTSPYPTTAGHWDPYGGKQPAHLASASRRAHVPPSPVATAGAPKAASSQGVLRVFGPGAAPADIGPSTIDYTAFDTTTHNNYASLPRPQRGLNRVTGQGYQSSGVPLGATTSPPSTTTADLNDAKERLKALTAAQSAPQGISISDLAPAPSRLFMAEVVAAFISWAALIDYARLVLAPYDTVDHPLPSLLTVIFVLVFPAAALALPHVSSGPTVWIPLVNIPTAFGILLQLSHDETIRLAGSSLSAKSALLWILAVAFWRPHQSRHLVLRPVHALLTGLTSLAWVRFALFSSLPFFTSPLRASIMIGALVVVTGIMAVETPRALSVPHPYAAVGELDSEALIHKASKKINKKKKPSRDVIAQYFTPPPQDLLDMSAQAAAEKGRQVAEARNGGASMAMSNRTQVFAAAQQASSTHLYGMGIESVPDTRNLNGIHRDFRGDSDESVSEGPEGTDHDDSDDGRAGGGSLELSDDGGHGGEDFYDTDSGDDLLHDHDGQGATSATPLLAEGNAAAQQAESRKRRRKRMLAKKKRGGRRGGPLPGDMMKSNSKIPKTGIDDRGGQWLSHWTRPAIGLGGVLFLTHTFMTGASVIPRWVGAHPSMGLLTIAASCLGTYLARSPVVRSPFAALLVFIGAGLLSFANGYLGVIGGALICFWLPGAWVSLAAQLPHRNEEGTYGRTIMLGLVLYSVLVVGSTLAVSWEVLHFGTFWIHDGLFKCLVFATCGAVAGTATPVFTSRIGKWFEVRPPPVDTSDSIVGLAVVLFILATFARLWFGVGIPIVSTVPADDPRWNVMTFNMHHGLSVASTDGLGAKVRSPLVETSDAIVNLIKRKDAHVSGLQSSDSSRIPFGNADVMESVQAGLGMHSNHGLSTRAASHGVGWLSAWELNDCKAFVLPSLTQPASGTMCKVEAGRVIQTQYGEIIGAETVEVAVVNVLWSHGSNAGLDHMMQANATTRVVSMIDDDTPVVLMGSFHVVPGSPAMDLLRKLLPGFSDAYYEIHGQHGSTDWDSETLDYVFTKGMVVHNAQVVLDAQGLSDHAPVWVRLSVPPRVKC